jgi:flagellar basal-body rod protein FlgB
LILAVKVLAPVKFPDGQNFPSATALTGKHLPARAGRRADSLCFQRFFPGGIIVALLGSVKVMIEALFNQPNYLAAKKTLDAVAMRQDAISHNLNNLETPGYQRVDLAPDFEKQLARATAASDAPEITSLSPTLAVDATAKPASKDGNTVHLEDELMRMNQNAMTHQLETQLVSGALAKLRLAITGHS